MGAKSQIAVAAVCVAVAASALAWTAPDCGGEKVSVVFTEFADPSGMEVYFRVPDMANAAPIPLVDDELINEAGAAAPVAVAWVPLRDSTSVPR